MFTRCRSALSVCMAINMSDRLLFYQYMSLFVVRFPIVNFCLFECLCMMVCMYVCTYLYTCLSIYLFIYLFNHLSFYFIVSDFKLGNMSINERIYFQISFNIPCSLSACYDCRNFLTFIDISSTVVKCGPLVMVTEIDALISILHTLSRSVSLSLLPRDNISYRMI